jgi:hypothetical protein
MAIDVEEPDGVSVIADPALGQSLTQWRRLPTGRQLGQLAAPGLDLRRAVEPEQDPLSLPLSPSRYREDRRRPFV